jgi:hypothetical protein
MLQHFDMASRPISKRAARPRATLRTISADTAPKKSQDVHCAPVFGNGYRSELKSKVRSMMSPWLGPQKIDVIRERQEVRAMVFEDLRRITQRLAIEWVPKPWR